MTIGSSRQIDRRARIGRIGTPQRVRLQLISNPGGATSLVGPFDLSQPNAIRLLLSEARAICKPGHYRMTVIGDSAQNPSVTATDGRSLLDGDRKETFSCSLTLRTEQ